MHQFQEVPLRPRHPQLFDHAKRHAAATVYSHPRRLVNGQQVLVFKEDREFPRRRKTADAGRRTVPHHQSRHGLRLLFGPLRGAYRRQAHHIAGDHAGVGRHPAFVDTHFTATNDAVHMGFGHALELADQKVVQPLAGKVRLHRHQSCLRRRWCGQLCRFFRQWLCFLQRRGQRRTFGHHGCRGFTRAPGFA